MSERVFGKIEFIFDIEAAERRTACISAVKPKELRRPAIGRGVATQTNSRVSRRRVG